MYNYTFTKLRRIAPGQITATKVLPIQRFCRFAFYVLHIPSGAGTRTCQKSWFYPFAVLIAAFYSLISTVTVV